MENGGTLGDGILALAVWFPPVKSPLKGDIRIYQITTHYIRLIIKGPPSQGFLPSIFPYESEKTMYQ